MSEAPTMTFYVGILLGNLNGMCCDILFGNLFDKYMYSTNMQQTPLKTAVAKMQKSTKRQSPRKNAAL